MLVEITNHVDLINFYIECGLEFQSLEYVGTPIYSCIIGSLDNIKAAVTVTEQGSCIVLDDLAVHKNYRNQGYGRTLTIKALEYISSLDNAKNVYIITKEPDFFSKFGFVPIERKNAPDFSICFQCKQYQKNCFPVAMVFNI